MVDYTIFYKSCVKDQRAPIPGAFDLFLSAYNGSERVRNVFDRVKAKKKIWVIHHEYRFRKSELPMTGQLYCCDDEDEASACRRLLDHVGPDRERQGSLCLDLTGFVQPHLMFLMALLWRLGHRTIHCLYSEPKSYLNRESTTFSRSGVSEVREVSGYGGVMEHDVANDWLVIGAGYDDRLISEVAQFKDSAAKAMIFGFPSSRADMYQQNLIRAHLAEDSLGPIPSRLRFLAPAYDPFVTASVLCNIVKGTHGLGPISNLYLAPLSTKAQVLGFVLFYLYEMQNTSTSIIFPYCPTIRKTYRSGGVENVAIRGRVPMIWRPHSD